MHLADAWNHITSNGLRYISNPPGNTARVHQHMEMGRGEVDFDAVFAALAAVDFDGVISSCVFGWEEDARGVSERQRDKALALIGKHFGDRRRGSRHLEQLDQHVREGAHHGNDAAPLEERRDLRGHGRSLLRRDQPGDRRGVARSWRWPARTT